MCRRTCAKSGPNKLQWHLAWNGAAIVRVIVISSLPLLRYACCYHFLEWRPQASTEDDNVPLCWNGAIVELLLSRHCRCSMQCDHHMPKCQIIHRKSTSYHAVSCVAGTCIGIPFSLEHQENTGPVRAP